VLVLTLCLVCCCYWYCLVSGKAFRTAISGAYRFTSTGAIPLVLLCICQMIKSTVHVAFLVVLQGWVSVTRRTMKESHCWRLGSMARVSVSSMSHRASPRTVTASSWWQTVATTAFRLVTDDYWRSWCSVLFLTYMIGRHWRPGVRGAASLLWAPPFPQIDIIGAVVIVWRLRGKNYQVCSVQYCVQQLCTVRCTHIWTD